MPVSHRHQVTTTSVNLIDINKYLQPRIASIVAKLHFRARTLVGWFANSMESADPQTSALANSRGFVLSYVVVSPPERFFRLPNTPHSTHGTQPLLRHRQGHLRHERWRQFPLAAVWRHGPRVCVIYLSLYPGMSQFVK